MVAPSLTALWWLRGEMGTWVNAESSGYNSDCKSELLGLMPANALYSRWYDVSHHAARLEGTKLVSSDSKAGGDHGRCGIRPRARARWSGFAVFDDESELRREVETLLAGESFFNGSAMTGAHRRQIDELYGRAIQPNTPKCLP